MSDISQSAAYSLRSRCDVTFIVTFSYYRRKGDYVIACILSVCLSVRMLTDYSITNDQIFKKFYLIVGEDFEQRWEITQNFGFAVGSGL